uniref:Uncharacterized protein n=1 Tax=Arundo donax TaxID=35708 RepID=A0A0A9CN48_ARUDO
MMKIQSMSHMKMKLNMIILMDLMGLMGFRIF